VENERARRTLMNQRFMVFFPYSNIRTVAG